MPYPARAIKKMYGKWEVDREMLVIRWRDEKHPMYRPEIDLERMLHSSGILDMIMQANTHTGAVYTNADIGDLIEAIECVLDPQSNYCPSGQEIMTHEKHVKLMKSLSRNGKLVNLKE